MSVEAWAYLLFILGAASAITGPAIAAIRTASKYQKAKEVKMTHTAVGALVDPAVVTPAARRDAWWGVAEFGLVALGVVLAAVASIILIPGAR